MNRAIGTGFGVCALLLSSGFLAATGCGSSPTTSTGTGGSPAHTDGSGGTNGSGGTDGSGGTGGTTPEGGSGGASAGTGGAGAVTLPFMALNPCTSEGAYTTTGNTIAYGGINLTYTPKCLKVAAGSQVTFVPASSGDEFSGHPLTHSLRGTQPSPISETRTGAMKTFTFDTPGFYPYYCEFHGSDDGSFMSGVIWVQ